jgi:predicted nucleic acid-binding protein
VGWIEPLRGKTVGLDTAPLIYYIEDHAVFADRLQEFFEAVASGEIRVVTSTVTLLEVLVQPLKKGNNSLAYQYNDILLSSPNIVTTPVSAATAQTAAELRAAHGLKTPDAIQLATAMTYQAAAFLTGDRDFGGIDSIDILKVSELIP